MEESGDIDIHVVRAEKAEAPEPPRDVPRARLESLETICASGLAVVVAVTMLNAFLD